MKIRPVLSGFWFGSIVALLLSVSALGAGKGLGQSSGPITGPQLQSVSAVLMEAASGEVLFEKDSHKALPPASVTKVMSMLLVMEAVDNNRIKLSDKVSASDNACSKGGSQIFLEPGETMAVETLLKSVAVASANDACVALAEYVGGTEEGFVQRMNERAKELGCKDTKFVNTNGLPPDKPGDPENLTSAYDIAVMSRELLKHPAIHKYLTIWMEPIRDGKFVLTNTNKLVRFYRGADGVKTGYTVAAKHCLSTSALRDGVRVISVVLGAPDSKTRFKEASQLMDLGFANLKSLKVADKGKDMGGVRVVKGVENQLRVVTAKVLSGVVRRASDDKFQSTVKIPDTVIAPIRKGQKIGTLSVVKDGKVLGSVDLVAVKDIPKAGFLKVIKDTMGMGIRSLFRTKSSVKTASPGK